MVELGNCSAWGEGGQVAVCKLNLIEGVVWGDWSVLLRCGCGFLSYACVVGWVIHVFHDEGVVNWDGTGTAGCYTLCGVLCVL